MLPPPYCYKINRCFAFTLAEVLITLVIVGIVSALTVPTLIAKYQEQQTVSKVKKVYSTFAQAYNRAVMDNGPADTWEIGTFDSPTGANNLYNYFKPYLIDTKRCDQSRGCWPDNY